MTSTPETPTRILYVVGSGRCGSTLLDSLLGQFDGVFASGELWYVWTRGVLGGGRCGCGAEFTSCPLWASVFEQAFGGFEGVDASEQASYRRALSTRHTPLLVTEKGRRFALRRLGSYPATMEILLRGVANTTGARVIVNASKDPIEAWILGTRSGLDVSVVHLVRDPRAAAFSWQRKKREEGYCAERYMPTYHPAASTALWATLNESGGWLRHQAHRYLLVRYEDFAVKPEHVVAQIGELIDEDFRGGPFRDDGKIETRPTHSVWGNPDRFSTGPVTIRADDEWTEGMSLRHQALVTAMTLPWIRRYGYPVRPQRFQNGRAAWPGSSPPRATT